MSTTTLHQRAALRIVPPAIVDRIEAEFEEEIEVSGECTLRDLGHWSFALVLVTAFVLAFLIGINVLDDAENERVLRLRHHPAQRIRFRSVGRVRFTRQTRKAS